jgi:hypothetical protein
MPLHRDRPVRQDGAVGSRRLIHFIRQHRDPEVIVMTCDHWFDALNRALVRDGPRRAVLNAAGAIAVSLAGGGLSVEAAKDRKKKTKGKGKRNGKGNGKKKDKKKGNGKGSPKLCGPEAQTACELFFVEEKDIKFCKDKCELCKAADIEFCIHEPDDEHPDDIHATCCPGDEVCCGMGCCAPDRCCEVNGVPRCVAPGESCCGNGVCKQGTTCCPGTGTCAFCLPPRTVDPVTCRCVCPEGQKFCDGACVDGAECPEACASSQDVCCGIGCFDWQTCCPDASNTFNGVKCAHLLSDRDHCGDCGNGCGASPRACCNGGCVDTSGNNSHCGTCFFACQGDRVCRPGQSGRGECQAP